MGEEQQDSFVISYKLANGPAPMEWETYERRARESWSALLASDPDEPEVQAFLERNPSFLPGHRSMTLDSGHAPYAYAVVTQPWLKGLSTKIPDFMWLAGVSDTIFPVLIEIERPGKKWFKDNGDTSAEFNHAHNQLATWRNWFRQEVNRTWFSQYYELPPEDLRKKVMEPSYVLIYGRRSEFDGHPERNRLRRDLLGAAEYHMTFDRLEPSRYAASYVTCRKPQQDGYEVVSVPPTFGWSPPMMEDFVRMTGWESAIQACDGMEHDRREFLLSRLSYWREWVARTRRVAFRAGDRE